MKNKDLKKITYYYILVPFIIFILGFIKLRYSIPITVMLILITIKVFHNNKCKDDNLLILENKKILIVFFIVFLICIFAGHGKFFYQSKDYFMRNAIFRDLVNRKWPVYYEKNNTALVYYIGQWLVPAVFGKIFFFLPDESRFMKANIALLFWNALGLTLSILWLFKIIKPKNRFEYKLSFILFIFFSGLDAFGMFLFGTYEKCYYRLHLEWWAINYQYSSMITQLFWVFNQCIVPWIVTLMFIEEKRVNNYVFIITLCLLYGPIPCVGIALILVFNGIRLLIESINNKKIIDFIKDVFSIQNVLSFITLIPILYFYYISNASVQGDSTGGGFSIIKDFLSIQGIILEFMFYFVEVGIYGILIFKEQRKNIMYYWTFIFLLIIPFFQLGYQADFSMRASISLLIMVNLWVIESVIFLIRNKKYNTRLIVLIVVLCIGCITPIVEFYRGFNYASKYIDINESADSEKTLNQEKTDSFSNFIVKNPKESSIFFKYIAK